MRWPQFLLSMANLVFAAYLLTANVITPRVVNPFTFLWALVYLALSTALAHLYLLYMVNKLDDWYDVESMKSINNLSVISMVLCGGVMVAYLGVEYHHNNDVNFIDQESWSRSAIIPLAAAVICSSILFTSSIKFKKYVILCKSIDLQPTQTQRRGYSATD